MFSRGSSLDCSVRDLYLGDRTSIPNHYGLDLSRKMYMTRSCAISLVLPGGPVYSCARSTAVVARVYWVGSELCRI